MNIVGLTGTSPDQIGAKRPRKKADERRDGVCKQTVEKKWACCLSQFEGERERRERD